MDIERINMCVCLHFVHIICLNSLRTDQSLEVMVKLTKHRRPGFECCFCDFEQLMHCIIKMHKKYL